MTLAEEGCALLRELQTAQGVSNRQLAKRAGVSHTAITRLYSGERVPRLDTFEKLLRALGFMPVLDIRVAVGSERLPVQGSTRSSPPEGDI